MSAPSLVSKLRPILKTFSTLCSRPFAARFVFQPSADVAALPALFRSSATFGAYLPNNSVSCFDFGVDVVFGVSPIAYRLMPLFSPGSRYTR